MPGSAPTAPAAEGRWSLPKIDSSAMATYDGHCRFLALIQTGKVVLGMPFLPLSDADIRVAEKDFVWRSYTVQRPGRLAATKKVEFVDKREYALATLGGPK